MVDALTVKVGDPSDTRQFFQLFDGANADDLNPQRSKPVTHIVRIDYLFHILASPEGDGRPPITVPRDVPIPCIRQPISEPSLPNELWHPVVVG